MERPANILELIENIKCVADSHLLLDADAFSNTFLARVFGAANIYRAADPGVEDVQVRSTDFDTLAKPEYAGEIRLPAINFVGCYRIEGGSPKALTSFSIRRGPTFDEIRGIFGDRMVQIIEKHPPPPLHGPRPTTGKHGNEAYSYDCSANGNKCQVAFHFAPDGTVDNACIRMERG